MRTRMCLLLTMGLVIVMTPLTGTTAETKQTNQRIVRGTVVATNLKDESHTIVVRVILPNKQELIVGASVPPNVGITRGTRAISLSDIKMGDVADLSYLKSPDGLVTHSIHVH